MGAGKPDLRPTKPEQPKSNLGTFIGAAVVLVALALPAIIYFVWESEMPALAPHEEAKLQKRLREIDDSEQYALLAADNGCYPCLHSGRTTCYLKKGEVWKYGVTSKGKFGRYSIDFFEKYTISYFVQFKGTYSECLKQEQVRLFYYPDLPENLARPPDERLPRPPYNPIMR